MRLAKLLHNIDKDEIKVVLIISCFVSAMFIYSNEHSTGVYDELLANGIPHHELIESGYPFPARSYWTQCTTGAPPRTNWYPIGILLDTCFAFIIVFVPYVLGNKIKELVQVE